jgi:hypothetical protein
MAQGVYARDDAAGSKLLRVDSLKLKPEFVAAL